jgi:phospholipid/cholesterol/gamma-HCH transport system permease protein
LADRLEGDIFQGQDNFAQIYELVGAYGSDAADTDAQGNKPGRLSFWAAPFFHHPVFTSLSQLGALVVGFWREFIAQSIFMGHVIMLVLMSVARPSRIRWAALFSLMQRAGIEAIPIVMLTNFFVGGVIAFLGILQLSQFGVSVFAVELVGISVFREFAPLIAAVLLSGRSASSFAAEIGSMKMNQEIDAMEVMSIDPYEALVVPRLLAMVVMMPLVTFLGALAGLCGGAVAVWTSLHFGPAYFIQRMSDNVPFVNFFVGMVKTPVYATIIALIGCRRGLTVKEDVISLGRQVTTAVVHSIFIIFMFNAFFAILFNGLNF